MEPAQPAGPAAGALAGIAAALGAGGPDPPQPLDPVVLQFVRCIVQIINENELLLEAEFVNTNDDVDNCSMESDASDVTLVYGAVEPEAQDVE